MTNSMLLTGLLIVLVFVVIKAHADGLLVADLIKTNHTLLIKAFTLCSSTYIKTHSNIWLVVYEYDEKGNA